MGHDKLKNGWFVILFYYYLLKLWLEKKGVLLFDQLGNLGGLYENTFSCLCKSERVTIC